MEQNETDDHALIHALLQFVNAQTTDNPSPYEAITRQMVESLSGDVKEIRNRINGLFWLIAGTVIVEILTRLAGLSS
jgi:hypothetical protein